MAENLQSILLPATLLSCAGAACGVALEYVAPGNIISSPLTNVSLGVLIFNGAQVHSAKILGKWYKDSAWYKYVFALQFGLLDGRNQTMVGNIKSAFEKNPDQDTLLVIVGRAHVDGMKGLLKNQLEFSEQPLN